MFYYRADLLEKYGEKVPETWEQLSNTAEKIVKAERAAGSEMYGMAGSMQQYEGLTCNAVEWFYSNGGDVFDENGKPVINSERNVEALELVYDMIRKGLYPEGILSYGSGDVRSMMFQGKLVFMRAWPKAWSLSQNPDNSNVVGKLGVAPIPRGERGQMGHSTLGGWQLFMAPDSKHKKEALAFMKFYTSEWAMKQHAVKDSYLPARKSLYSDAEVLEANPFFGMITDVLENAVPRPQTPFYSEASSIIQVEVQLALQGKKTSREALDDAQKQLEVLLK